MSTQFTLPPDTRAIGTGSPPDDVNALIDTVIAMGASQNVLNAAFAGGADPTGGADSTAAFQAALNACAEGQSVYAPAGNYLISSPITIPPFVGLRGDPASTSIAGAAAVAQGGGGTVLVASASFTAGTWPNAAVILVVDQATGSYANKSQEQHVRDLMITGSALPGTSAVDGIQIYSGADSTGQTAWENILVYNMTGWGFSMPNGSGQIRARNVITVKCGTNNSLNAGGFQVQASDSNFMFCESNSHFGDAWNILDGWDSTFLMCHGEHSGAGYGFHFKATANNSTPDIGGINFIGCTVDGGELQGWFLESTGSNMPPVTITGGFVRRAGTSGTFAGVIISGYFGPVNLVGMQVEPGQPDGGGSDSPFYALSLQGNGPATNVSISGGVWIGTSAWLNCDGTQGSLTVSGDTIFGAGIANSTNTYAPGVALQANGTTELLPADRVLLTQPLGTVATTLDRSDVSGSFSPASGIPVWHLVTLIAGVPVTSVLTWVTGSAKSGGSHGWVAIASVATGLVVARSADQTDASTTWGSAAAAQPVALTSVYTPPFTGPYWIGVCITASSMPALGAVGNAPDASIAAMPPIYCGPSGSQATPPAVGASGGPTSAAVGDDIYMWAI